MQAIIRDMEAADTAQVVAVAQSLCRPGGWFNQTEALYLRKTLAPTEPKPQQ